MLLSFRGNKKRQAETNTRESQWRRLLANWAVWSVCPLVDLGTEPHTLNKHWLNWLIVAQKGRWKKKKFSFITPLCFLCSVYFKGKDSEVWGIHLLKMTDNYCGIMEEYHTKNSKLMEWLNIFAFHKSLGNRWYTYIPAHRHLHTKHLDIKWKQGGTQMIPVFAQKSLSHISKINSPVSLPGFGPSLIFRMLSVQRAPYLPSR